MFFKKSQIFITLCSYERPEEEKNVLILAQSALASAYIMDNASLVLGSFLNSLVCIHIATGIVINFSGVGPHNSANHVIPIVINGPRIPIVNRVNANQAGPLTMANGIR